MRKQDNQEAVYTEKGQLGGQKETEVRGRDAPTRVVEIVSRRLRPGEGGCNLQELEVC
jgi:hypothetical protein